MAVQWKDLQVPCRLHPELEGRIWRVTPGSSMGLGNFATALSPQSPWLEAGTLNTGRLN